jgi:hypothetical protein
VDLLESVSPRSADLLEQWVVDLLLERPSMTTPLDDEPTSTTIPLHHDPLLPVCTPLLSFPFSPFL